MNSKYISYLKKLSINIYVCGSVWFWKINPKFDIIQMILTKEYSDTSNNSI